jgi:hypothetical protein
MPIRLIICKCCAVCALVVLGWSGALDTKVFAQPDQAAGEEGVQVLTRGPVHEAFAETVTFDPEQGIEVPNSPPAAIEELPPDQKPEGANVAWIPGYWGWDDEANDFLWVSGIWRALPPGRQWVPGYWGKSGQGFQWTSGYWADAATSEVEYLPEPPETAEAGPNIAAPSVDSTWLPGSWVWHENRYVWRPGFWAAVQPNWVWVPDHYVWAPRGYVFVNGYWDYSIDRRGVLFAPVHFDRGVYGRPGFSYSPATVIDLSVFTNHLFLRPRYQHYYFGDYYAANYQNAGFLPWFSFQSSRYGYDPIYAHQRWQSRQNPQWEQRLEADFRLRRDQEDARPPRTWAAQRALGEKGVDLPERGFVIGEPLAHRATSKDNPRSFQALDNDARQKLAQYRQEVEKTRDARRTLESDDEGRLTRKPPKEFVPVKRKLPRSPFMAKPAAELGQEDAPPKIYDAPQPDLKVTPKPRGEAREKSRGEARTKAEGDAKAKSERETRSVSEGKARAKAEGDTKGKSEGDTKGKSGRDAKGNSGREARSVSGGKARTNAGGDAKGKSGGDAKGKPKK